MPRYDYQCRECGSVAEHVFTMAEKPDLLACECGGQAASLINGDVEVLVKGNQRPMKLTGTCVPVGWERGNTDPDVQERRYAEIINSERKAVRANDKKAIRNGFRKIASVPRELHRMRTNQYGKSYWQEDTKAKLKSDGLLHTD